MSNLSEKQLELLKKNREKRSKKSIENYYKNPNICLECGKIIEIPEGKRAKHVKRKKFCDRSCAAKFNGRIFPKRKPKHKCKKCGIAIISGRKYCKKCFKEKKIINLSKGEVFKLYSKSKHQTIRLHARSVHKKTKCIVCGYNIFTEVCHIKAIKEFSDETLIGEINNKNNLVSLCPNHHWEFDNNILDIKKYLQDVV